MTKQKYFSIFIGSLISLFSVNSFAYKLIKIHVNDGRYQRCELTPSWKKVVTGVYGIETVETFKMKTSDQKIRYLVDQVGGFPQPSNSKSFTNFWVKRENEREFRLIWRIEPGKSSKSAKNSHTLATYMSENCPSPRE